VNTTPSSSIESAFVVRGEVSPDTIRRSLEALLPTRHRRIGRRRFTVLDTFDGRIRRSGTRLTRGDRDGSATVFWEPRGAAPHLSVQLKQPAGFAWDFPEGPLQQELAPVIGVRRLLAQADAERYGSLLDIIDERGKTVARLRIESGRARPARSHSAWQALPTVITLTGLRGYEQAYERLLPVIESRPGIEACPEGLHGIVLRQVGVADRDTIGALRNELQPGVRARTGARQIHLALLRILVANEPGVREKLDTEFLHDFRVGVRRTRSLLGQIRHVFPASVVEHFSTEFSWLGRLTGPPRDMDVLLLALRTPQAGVTPADLAELVTFLTQAQEVEHQRLVAALDSDRYHQLITDWRAFLEEPGRSSEGERNADRALAEVVSKRAWRVSERIAGAAAAIDDRTPPDRLHQVRIDAKKLRYLVDVTSAFYDGADLDTILAALKRLQRVLGDFNDAHVQEQRLLECGRAAGPLASSGALLALGRLAERRRQRSELLRAQVSDALARFQARDTRAAYRRAFRLSLERA
jgi:CHAD domain-containing protein